MASHERTSEMGDAALHARAQSVLGRYYSKVDQSELALFHYTEALDAMNEAGDVQSLVEITMLLGEVLQDAGRKDEAMEHYGQALVLAEANDLRMQIGELLTRLGGWHPINKVGWNTFSVRSPCSESSVRRTGCVRCNQWFIERSWGVELLHCLRSIK